MKHPLSTIGLLSAALLATAAPVLAAPAGNDRPPPIAGPEHAGSSGREGPRNPGLDLAAKLSAAETYVGVTAGQEDAWRAYTSALIAFLDHPLPLRGDAHGDRPGPDGGPQQPAGQPGPDVDAGKPQPLVSERIADRAIDRADKAKSLKAAVAALRSTLDPGQLKRLALAENMLRPPPRGLHGSDRDRGARHGEHGPRNRAGPPPLPRGDMPPPPPEQ